MKGRTTPILATLAATDPVIVPVCMGTGDRVCGVSAAVNTLPVVGLAITLTIRAPIVSLVACLDLAQLECLEDQLRDARAQLETALGSAR